MQFLLKVSRDMASGHDGDGLMVRLGNLNSLLLP